MSGELATIVTAYNEGLSPEQIAEDRNLDIGAVKAALMNGSAAYRKACGQESADEDELNFSRDEQIRVKRMMLDLALSADDEHLRAKMCVNIRDDAKGRKDVVKSMTGQNFNILMINEKMQQVRAMADSVKSRMLGSPATSNNGALNV